jgi:hypothetical protein
MKSAEAQFDANHWLTIRYDDVMHDPSQGFEKSLRFPNLEWIGQFTRGFVRHDFRPEPCKHSSANSARLTLLSWINSLANNLNMGIR